MAIGPVVGFFGGADDASKAEAVAWVRSEGWTQGDVAIKLVNGNFLVYAKRRLW